MWLPLIIYLLANTNNSDALEFKDKLGELIDLFIENLKVDPILADDYAFSIKSKRFVDDKLDLFLALLAQSQRAKYSRPKRSLIEGNETEEQEERTFSIDISSKTSIPTEYPDDIRLFQYQNSWFATTLENKNLLTIYQYTNGSFSNFLQYPTQLTTTMAVTSKYNRTLIVVASKELVKILQFIPGKRLLTSLQTIAVSNAKHVALWEQHDSAYLAITTTSNIQIYCWLGKHFDHVQDVQLENTKKTVPFAIHGGYFLAVVNQQEPIHPDGDKTYSMLLKYDFHLKRFVIYQPLLTNGCSDIKHFRCVLHGLSHHFIIVGHKGDLSVVYKYEDQYFIPFQSIVGNVVEWQPVQDSNGDAALLAITTEGLKAFQYDGWNFFENTVIKLDDNDANKLRMGDVTKMHTYYNFESQPILVIVCDYCKNSTNIFSIAFQKIDVTKKMHSELLDWCTKTVEDLEDQADKVLGESLRGDITEQISFEEDQKRQLSAALTATNQTLFELQNELNKTHIFNHNLQATTIVFNNTATINQLQTISFNHQNIDEILNNILNIEEGFSLNTSMQFNILLTSSNINPSTLNAISSKQYMRSTEDGNIEELVVDGSVTFNDGISVEGSVNNIAISEKELLLKQGDQVLSSNINANGIVVENLNATIVGSDEEISYIKRLKVKELQVKGFINRVSLPVLAKRALKKDGNQVLHEPLYVEELSVDVLNAAANYSGKIIPNDFALIHAGEYEINRNVEFLKELKLNKLEVLNTLNKIPVNTNGDLDILLTESPFTQHVAIKSFEYLVTTKPILLHNKISNDQMQLYNPVIIDSSSYDVDGDVTINGWTNVSRWLKAADLKANGVKSFGDVFERGVKLTDAEIAAQLLFTQPLELEDVIADRVNSMNPHEWVLAVSNSSQIIKGHKRFVGDLLLEGNVDAFKINNVDVHRLEKDALRLQGDQEIDGVLEVEKVVANKGLQINQTQLKTSPQLNLNSTLTISGNLKVGNLSAINLELKNSLNSQNLSHLLRNLVRKNAKFTLFGRKTFKHLKVDDLRIVKDGKEFLHLFEDIINNNITINNNIELFNPVNISHLKVVGNVNNIDIADLNGIFEDAADTTIVTSAMEYDELVVLGDVFVDDNKLNNNNLTRIEADTVKVDEDHSFGNVNFDDTVLVHNKVQLLGNIESLDLDSVVEQNIIEPMELQHKNFMDLTIIQGTLLINNTVNGLNFNRFCDLSMPSEKLKKLKINGNVLFAKGPKIRNINGMQVKDLEHTLWFDDTAATIVGNVRLQNATFNDSVEVKEYIDGQNLNLLLKNYLSKSKHQTVWASLNFEDATFINFSTPALIIKGPLNGINIDDLIKTILLQDVPQIFETPVYFEEIILDHLNEDADYTVNDLNLNTDVMRYDQVNVVTGLKVLHNLNVDRVNFTHNVMVQKVDILEWLENAVLVEGTFEIKGKKKVRQALFKQSLGLRGQLNQQDFNEDTIMLVDVPQHVAGYKTFLGNQKFKTLRVKGNVNGVDIEELVDNQLTKSGDITLNTQMVVFDSNLVTNNINLHQLNNNSNVNQLISNVTKLDSLGKLENKFQRLMQMGLEVEDSLKDSAVFFKYYKQLMYLDDVYDILGVNCQDGVFRVVAFYWANGASFFKSFEFEPEIETFVSLEENIKSYRKPSFMLQLMSGNKDYVYIEHAIEDLDGGSYGFEPTYSGQLLQLRNATHFEILALFNRNQTVSLVSFTNPDQKQLCLGFINSTLAGIDIYCDENEYYWSETIHLEGIFKAFITQSEDAVYLFLARHGRSYIEPSVVIYKRTATTTQFEQVQTIYEGAEFNDLAAAMIEGVPYLALSFGPQEATVESGRISVKRFDTLTNKFVSWQHLPIAAPLGVNFIEQTLFEPLLLVATYDVSGPLHILRYDGLAGFKEILKGSSLAAGSKVKVIGRGHFLAVLQEDRYVGRVLGAIVNRSVRN